MTDLDQRPDRRTGRLPAALRHAAPALLVYAGVRALGLAVLALWCLGTGKSPHTLLTARWDSLWYVRVAEHGYGWQTTLPDGTVHSNLAFFPLLPWLERLVSALTPLSYADAGMVVAWLASLAAAWGIFLIADRMYGRRAGVCAVALWAVLPVGIVQSMAYSESLFTALAAWSLYAVLRERWVTAGLLAALAGLTRPVGMAVVAALWVAAVLWVVREKRAPWRPVLGALLAPLGAAGYVLWVGQRTGGGLFGYLDVQKQWGNGFDFGYAFVRFIADKFTSFPSALAGAGLIVGVVLVIWLYVTGVRQKQPVPLLVYTGIVVALALCASGYFGSKPRLLMPAFPLLLPLAVALGRLRTSRSAAVLAVVGAASAVYGALWLNGSGPP
ncbi:glycosyltransferase family 39 protein [Streptomyces indicus]|uniref:Dolichyl-phosphate-mannose-protein mannosyltransferase n=1 Tax=Streptomyces indicus TaxID=417292 RepID=A0A1G8XY36_9ACTN|nr:glycosyltransferase family 39 protein [Streptomyces indicus]SDJ95084.1 Dolichyl-phosphate-mannose-protein mannosyltransferase [Streptomyces indicus]